MSKPIMCDFRFRVLLWCDMQEDAGRDAQLVRAKWTRPATLAYGDGYGGGGDGYGDGYGGDGYGGGGDGYGGDGGGGYGDRYGGDGYGDGGDGYGGDGGYGDGGYGDQTLEARMISGLVILIRLDRWVTVGVAYADSDNPLFVRLENASTVRIWGTATGLGQLAREGPLPNTKLDAIDGETQIAVMDIKQVIQCNESAWKQKHYLPKTNGRRLAEVAP